MSDNKNPSIRFHWACALPVIAIFAMLIRGTTVMEIAVTAVFLLVALGAGLVTWFIGRKQPRAGSLGFFCVMVVAAIWVAQHQNLTSTWASTAQLQEKFDNVMNQQLGMKHKAKQAGTTQRTESK